nr:uncharacterized GPI-anchored protein At4g28100-like [Ipomoea batatas]
MKLSGGEGGKPWEGRWRMRRGVDGRTGEGEEGNDSGRLGGKETGKVRGRERTTTVERNGDEMGTSEGTRRVERRIESSYEGNEIVSVEGIESLCDGAVVAYEQEGDVLTQNLGPLYDDLGDKYTSIDEFFSFEEDKTDNLIADPQGNGTFEGKEIATMENMDSGILQYTTHLGAYQYDENGELTSMNSEISNKARLFVAYAHTALQISVAAPPSSSDLPMVLDYNHKCINSLQSLCKTTTFTFSS